MLLNKIKMGQCIWFFGPLFVQHFYLAKLLLRISYFRSISLSFFFYFVGPISFISSSSFTHHSRPNFSVLSIQTMTTRPNCDYENLIFNRCSMLNAFPAYLLLMGCLALGTNLCKWRSVYDNNKALNVATVLWVFRFSFIFWTCFRCVHGSVCVTLYYLPLALCRPFSCAVFVDHMLTLWYVLDSWLLYLLFFYLRFNRASGFVFIWYSALRLSFGFFFLLEEVDERWTIFIHYGFPIQLHSYRRIAGHEPWARLCCTMPRRFAYRTDNC